MIVLYDNTRFGNFENAFLVRARASRPNKRRACVPSIMSRFKQGTYRVELLVLGVMSMKASYKYFEKLHGAYRSVGGSIRTAIYRAPKVDPQHDRCCRRRHQRHGRIQERSGLEMCPVSCATSSFLPRRRATSSRRVGFGRCSPCTTSTTPRTSPFPNPRRPLVSVSSRSRRIRKLLPQLCVCVSRLVTMVCIWYHGGLVAHDIECDMVSPWETMFFLSIWYGAPARLADSTSWVSCFATTRWSLVTLVKSSQVNTHPNAKSQAKDKRAKDRQKTPEKGRRTFFYSLTRRSRVQVLPTRDRNNDT